MGADCALGISGRSSFCSTLRTDHHPLGGFHYTPKAVIFGSMPSAADCPITVALVNDYDVVLMGVACMFDQYRDRVVVAELDATMNVDDRVDIVLYDNFAQPEV